MKDMTRLIFFTCALFVLFFNMVDFLHGEEQGEAIHAEVTSVAFSADGKYLASGCDDNTVRIWDTKTGKEVRILKWHMKYEVASVALNMITSVAFSPDDKCLASGGAPIILWDVKTGKEVRVLVPNGITDSVAFSPDGKYIASGGWKDTIQLWDTKTGEEVRILKGHGSSYSIAFSPDSKYLAAGGSKHIYSDELRKEWKGIVGIIGLWDTKTGKEVQHIEIKGNRVDEVTSIAFSPDGKFLASGGGSILLWDVKTGKEVKLFKKYDAYFKSLVFSTDGKYLAAVDSRRIMLWNARTGEEIKTLKGHKYYTSSVAFSPDGKYLASGGADHVYTFRNDRVYLEWEGADYIIKLWDVVTGKEVMKFKGDILH